MSKSILPSAYMFNKEEWNAFGIFTNEQIDEAANSPTGFIGKIDGNECYVSINLTAETNN